MDLHFNVFNTLILAGCVQGIILSGVIIARKRSPAAAFLSLLVLAFSLDILYAVCFDIGLSWQVPPLLIAPLSFILGIGPFLYWHVRLTVQADRPFRKKDVLHLVPVLLELAWYAGLSLFFWGRSADIVPFYRRYETAYGLPEQLAGMMSVAIYLVFTLQLLKKNKQRVRDNYSSIEGREHKRLYQLTILLASGWTIWCMLLLADSVFYDYSLEEHVYYPLYLLMSFTVYAIGYSGFLHPPVIIPLPAAEKSNRKQSNPENAALVRRARLVLEEEQLYLDSDLRIKTVAEKVGVDTPKLSAALRSETSGSFYDFVNEYRVQEVKRRLSSQQYDHMTILSIAYDCGFNSKTTFNDFFKKYTGQTPKAFKISSRNMSE